MKKEFIFFDIEKVEAGEAIVLFDSGENDPYRSLLIANNNSGRVDVENSCLFGFNYEDECEFPFNYKQNTFHYLRRNNNHTASGKWIYIARVGYDAPYLFGGPIEEKGRLKYIDGCSDSLLIPPVKKGDPCLNHLHFPVNINQTMHTHPTLRAGIVARGEGICRWYDEAGQLHHTPLRPGLIWIIPPDVKHAFQTFDKSMDVIAYHPDSDFGPTDEEHPMINRTYVDGVSANQLPDIQTKEIV